MYSDEEWLDMVGASDEEPSDPAPPLSTWTPEVDMLAKVVDSLAVLTQTLIGVNGGKAKKVTPVPRPLTSSDKPTEFTEAQQSILDDFAPRP